MARPESHRSVVSTGTRRAYQQLYDHARHTGRRIRTAACRNRSSPQSSRPASLKAVFADPRFWRLAPLSATCVGSAWALQGLWAAPWLTDVEGLDGASLITRLFIMAVALSFGALLLGTIADRMRWRGLGPHALLSAVAIVFIAAQLALILRLPVPSSISWSIVSAVGAGTVLSYAIIAEYFPKELAGRANAALNVFHLGWAFVFQWSTGLILEQWPTQDGLSISRLPGRIWSQRRVADCSIDLLRGAPGSNSWFGVDLRAWSFLRGLQGNA